MGEEASTKWMTFLNWLHLDIKSFLVCPSVEVRTSVLCFSQDLADEMWQEIRPNQLKQK